jgi:hypothetical protein
VTGKNGKTLFDRPKPTAGCSANGRRRLASVSYTQRLTSWVENRLLACVGFSKLVVSIHPPLNILTVPDWLNFKCHYFQIGPKVKISNTLTPLAPIYVTLYPLS